MIIIKKEKIVHGIKIVKNRDFFLQDKNRFERTEQLWLDEHFDNSKHEKNWISLHRLDKWISK